MTRNTLLDALVAFTKEHTKDLILPVSMQASDKYPDGRAAEVHKMRLPDSKAAKKKAPYIIHQVITGKDVQPQGQRTKSTTIIRSIFCVYSDDEEEGGCMLLELMERLRVEILKNRVVGKQFVLEDTEGIDILIYPDDTAPYFAGEMSTVWKMPSVEREVDFEKGFNSNS